MTEVQLDKNSNARRLRDECNDEGIVKCCALPRHLFDSEDDEIIAFASQRGRLLLTYDRPIAYDWPQFLVNGFPGILILALEDNSPKHMGRKIAMQMLRRFKNDCSEWHSFDCRNSIIELQPVLITINHVDEGIVTRTGWLDRSSEGWQERLRELLRLNADRSRGPEPS